MPQNSRAAPATSAREPHATRRRNGVRDQAFDVIVRCYADAVGADTAVLLAHQEGTTQVLSDWAREGHELSVAWTGESLLGRAFAADGPLLDSPASSERPTGREPEIHAVAAPIRSTDSLLGAIYAGFSPPSTADERELVWATESYARLAALSMVRDVSIARVLGSVGLDVLTGCLSYEGLIEVLKAEVERSQRNRHGLSCCFIDLDGFKMVNDQRGHLEGNRVLAAVGDALRETARAYDAVGRFGGDEFVLVLPETSGRAANHVAERARVAVRAAIAESTTVRADVSIGVIEWDGTGGAMELLAAADEALHEAKRAGGSRINGGSAIERADGLLELTRDLMRRRRFSTTARPNGNDPPKPDGNSPP